MQIINKTNKTLRIEFSVYSNPELIIKLKANTSAKEVPPFFKMVIKGKDG